MGILFLVGLLIIFDPRDRRIHVFGLFWAQRPYYIRLLGFFDAQGYSIPQSPVLTIVKQCLSASLQEVALADTQNQSAGGEVKI